MNLSGGRVIKNYNVMRVLSKLEQEICNKVLKGSKSPNNFLANILDPWLGGVKIKITDTPLKVEFLYNVPGNNSPIEFEDIVPKMGEISVLILTSVNLIKMLEKEGYIMLLQSTNNFPQPYEFGNAVSGSDNVYYEFVDDNISNLLAEYVKKEIYITEEFNHFCANNFIPRDELRHSKQLRSTKGILRVAITALIINTLALLYQLFFKN